MTYVSSSFTRRIAPMAIVTLCLMIIIGSVSAQTTMPSDAQIDSGLHQYSSYDGTVSLMSGNLTFCVPLVSLPGRAGFNLNIPLCYNSEFNEVQTTAPGTGEGAVTDAISWFPWVWGSSTAKMGPGWTLTGRPVVYTTSSGTGGDVLFMADGSKYGLPAGGGVEESTGEIFYNPTTGVHLKDGTVVLPGQIQPNNSGFATVTDAHGNTITYTSTSVTDTVGRTVNVSATNAAGATPSTLVFQYPASNGTATVTVQFLPETYSCPQSTPQTPGPGPFGASGSYAMPSAVILPSGLTYTFGYDSCGHVIKVTYPNGGYTRYVYTQHTLSVWGPGEAEGTQMLLPYIVNEVTAKYDCTAPAVTLGSTSAAPGNTCPVAELLTSYNPTSNQNDTNNSENIVTDPLGNQTVYQFTQATPSGQAFLPAVETFRSISNGTKVLRTIATAYTPNAAGNNNPLLPVSRTTTLDNGMVSQVQWTYDFRNLSEYDSPVTSKLEYDYGVGAPGALLRKTVYDWLQLDYPQVYTEGPDWIMDRETRETVYNGSGTMVADTKYIYDNGSPGGNANVTSIEKWSNTANAYLTTQMSYNPGGTLASTVDPNGNTTSYGYIDNYTDGVSRNSNAFVTQITYPTTNNGASHVIQKQYYWGSGLLAASCGENYSGTCAIGKSSVSDYTSYAYDVMGHQIEVTTGDGGSVATCYSEIVGANCHSASYPLTVTSTEAIAIGLAKTTTNTMDGLGRVTETQLKSDPFCSTGTLLLTTYDGDGRVSTKSNPYCGTSDPTYGITTYTYDALNRITEVLNPDGTDTTSTYTGRAELNADEGNGNVRVQHISQKDALGRRTSVCEVSNTTQQGTSNNTPISCGLDVSGTGFLTSYSYDPLGNLVSVAQGGENRSFIYDSLSRITSATNLESGTTTYGYDNDSNLTSKTSARGTTTTYRYDALNRLQGRSYSDNVTPSACFEYDQGTNGKGRLSIEWTQASTPTCPASPPGSGVLTERTFAAYDLMGRIATDKQCSTLGNCTGTPYTASYAYNLAGDVASFTNGLSGTSMMSFSNTYDSVGHLATLVGPSAAGTSYEPVNLFTSDGYNAAGDLLNAQIGPGIALQRTYNNRLRPISETDQVATTPGTATIQITGAEQSSGSTTGSITFSGTEQSEVYEGTTDYDSGSFITSINGGAAIQVSYGQSSTPQSIATSLASVIGCAYGPVKAVAIGATVNLSSCTSGAGTNYTMSAYLNGHSSIFAKASFAVTTSGSTMTLPPATFATGTIFIGGEWTEMEVLEVFFEPNQYGGPVSIGTPTSITPAAVASALAAEIPPCSANQYFSAAANGPAIDLTSCTAGPGGNYAITTSGGGSLTMTPSGPTLTGGESLPGVYDSGTVNLTINGVQIASAPYDAGSTPTSIASALVTSGSSNTLVTLSSNGASLTMLAKGDGTYSDYTYALTVDYNTADFTQASFSASSTSGSLAGGENAPLYSWAINSYAPNGDVLSMTDSVMGAWTYGYDDMNRLVTGSASAGSMAGFGLSWTYDRYGNRWNQSAAGNGSAVQTNFTFSANNNRIDQFSSNYDADGNLLSNGTSTYTYDAENRIVTLNGEPTYIYDAEGTRVAKLSTGGAVSAVYILGLGGQQMTEINASGQWVHSNVFASDGGLVATFDGPGSTVAGGYHYHLTDWLGTERLQTNANGNEDEQCVSYPFGDGLTCTGPRATDATEQHFTGKERDTESGLDYFGARYFATNFGRFMTPDWAEKATGVPYANYGNPQSLNLYSYVHNNPNSGIDSDGHDGIDNK